MTPRFRAAIAIVAVPLLAYPLVSTVSGAPRFPTPGECVKPAVGGQSVDLVFGRFDDPRQADQLRDRALAAGFRGTESLPDGCGRWKVVLESVPSVEVAREVQKEAGSVGLAPTLELGSSG